MSVPTDQISQLLAQLQGSGIFGVQPQPQVNSGLLGALNQSLGQYGGIMGLSSAIGAHSNDGGAFTSILGKSLQESQQLSSRNAQDKLQLAQTMMGLQNSLNDQKFAQQFLNRGVTQQAQAAVATDGAPQGAPQQQNPQGQQGAQQPGMPPPSMSPGGPSGMPQPGPQQGPADISQLPVGGMDPNFYRYAAYKQGKDVLATNKEIHDQQLQAAQEAVKPQIAMLDTYAKSDSPAAYVKANPQMLAAFRQAAPQMGINPDTQMTDQTVRSVLNMQRNQLAARYQLGEEAPNVQLKTVKLPDGRTAQLDPVSGKLNIEAPSALVKVRGKDGKPVFVPEGQAAGMTPYNEQMAASDDALQSAAEDVANYKLPPPTGSKLLSGNWPEVMRLVKNINPGYDATQFTTKNKARMSFATGKQGDIVRSLSVATDHLDQLSQAASALNNGGLPAANKVANFFSQQTGNPAVTNFDSMKEIVGDEVVKAVVGSTGGVGDRDAIKKTFSDANSPQQLAGVIQKYKGLMGGQLKGLRQQYQRTTGLNDFDAALSDNAKTELTPQTAATSAPQTKVLNGVTYTFNNGKWYHP